jgi:dihydrofolate reductase
MLGWFQPDHHPLILTRDEKFTPPVGQAVADINAALEAAARCGARELYVCGGGGAYAAAIPLANRLILTHVGTLLHAGVPFPAFDPGLWQVASQTHAPADAENRFDLIFTTYEQPAPQKKGD